MLGILAYLIAGQLIERLWPTGVSVIVGLPAIMVPLTMWSRQSAVERLGETVDWSARAIAVNYTGAVIIAAILVLLSFGTKQLIRKLRARDPAS